MSCYQILKEKGYRITPQRTIILDILHRTEKHITPEEIHEQVCTIYPDVNKSTIYRNLDMLKNLGLVDETDMGGDQLYYHHSEKGHHHHLICQKCGRTFDIDEKVFYPIKETLIRNHNFVPDIRHLGIFGHCFDCASPSPSHNLETKHVCH